MSRPSFRGRTGAGARRSADPTGPRRWHSALVAGIGLVFLWFAVDPREETNGERLAAAGIGASALLLAAAMRLVLPTHRGRARSGRRGPYLTHRPVVHGVAGAALVVVAASIVVLVGEEPDDRRAVAGLAAAPFVALLGLGLCLGALRGGGRFELAPDALHRTPILPTRRQTIPWSTIAFAEPHTATSIKLWLTSGGTQRIVSTSAHDHPPDAIAEVVNWFVRKPDQRERLTDPSALDRWSHDPGSAGAS